MISYKGRITGLEVKSGRTKHSRSLLMSLRDGSIRAGIKMADFRTETDDNGVLHLPLFAPSFMESETEVDIDLPDASELDRAVRESQ